MGFSHLQQKTGFVVLPAATRGDHGQYVAHVDERGIVSVVPRSSRRRSWFPVKILCLLLLLVTLFKALSLTSVGINGYEMQLSALQSGTVFEKAAAWALQVDPATKWIYVQSKPFLS